MYLSKIEVKGLDELNGRIATARGWLKKMTFLERQILVMKTGDVSPDAPRATAAVVLNSVSVKPSQELERVLCVMEKFAEGLDLTNRPEPQ